MDQQRINDFWTAYQIELCIRIKAKPQDYALLTTDTAESYAVRVAGKMRAAVEDSGSGVMKGFGAINYVGSGAFRAAARAVGQPFNLKGLNSLYLS